MTDPKRGQGPNKEPYAEKPDVKATLLFNQNAIKAVVLCENLLIVHYADGQPPMLINQHDVLYDHHRKQFDDMVKANLKPVEEDDEPLAAVDVVK